MNFDRVEPLVRALLYEGFMLYPYRPTSVKNKKRFAFGTLAPGEVMQTECIVRGDERSRLTVSVRFLDEHDRERAVDIERVALGESRMEMREHAEVVVQSERVGARSTLAYKIHVRVTNASARDEMLSTHTILGVEDAELVSMLEPPNALADLAASCRNVGTWPVLVGDASVMLSSPIILYDHPRIAPESPGDLFDATEIDEILTLRVLALSDDEKREMARGDARVRAVLARTEALGDDARLRLHGAQRLTGQAFKPGDRVRLRPKARADAFDALLAGQNATIESVEQDYEGRIALTVTVDADPGRDLGKIGQVGHRFFFAPEEVERIA